MDDLSLATEFAAATREQWLKLVEGVLKGADFEKKLVSRTHDGLTIEPLYPKAAGAVTARAATGPWRVSQRVDHPDPATANALALADLEGGADSLAIVFEGAPSSRGFGVKVGDVEDLDRALQGVMLDLVALRIETAPFGGRLAADRIAELVRRRGLDPAQLSIDFGLDPVGDLARTGKLPLPWSDLSQRAIGTTAGLREKGFVSPTFRIDGRPYHEAGASEAQELAAALATGLTYLRALEAAGHRLEDARDALTFLLVADTDEFLTVAKFRAMRRLWARVEEACGLTPQPIRLHAETAWRTLTRRDPWVNLLRATVATFSAGIGGADAVTVLPFTSALGLADAFARRLARNTQLVLIEEANLWRVADPAAGAGGFEALTDSLSEKAWGLFQEIEREGGIVASLSGGALQQRIAAVRGEREHAVATRKDPITGTSEFPNIHEAAVSLLLPAPPPSPAGETAALSLPSMRAAEPFEMLREASDAYLARTGARPKVFLATLGSVADFTAPTTFAKNFFESGGIEAIIGDGFPNHDALLQAHQESKAKLICICSSDELYSDQLFPTIMTLRHASKSSIYVAVRPGKLEQEARRAGATACIYAGCDALNVLSEALHGACA